MINDTAYYDAVYNKNLLFFTEALEDIKDDHIWEPLFDHIDRLQGRVLHGQASEFETLLWHIFMTYSIKCAELNNDI